MRSTGQKSLAGTARLSVVAAATLVGVIYAAALDYSLPLYFSARDQFAESEAARYPASMWSSLWKYQQSAWIVGPLLAGVLTRRYGERWIWSLSLAGSAIVPAALALHPSLAMIRILALWLGITGSLAWVAGVSLVQMVPSEKKGVANGLMMISFGVGSIFAALASRGLLYRHELGEVLSTSGIVGFARCLISLDATASTPVLSDFAQIFWILAASCLACAILVACWSQRPGNYSGGDVAEWGHTARDLRQVLQSSKFWALTLTLCVLGGAVFAATNQFMPYRAEELGLKVGAKDHGWIWLQLLKPIMWIPGGIIVGLVAGRRAPGLAAVVMLATFSLSALGIGLSHVVWQLFLFTALYETVRQLMRWSHSGYLSEHMPEHLRATAIGCSITCAGIGATLFSWVADFVWNPDADGFHSTAPFVASAVIGIIASTILFVFDRARPIRTPVSVDDVPSWPEPGVSSETALS